MTSERELQEARALLMQAELIEVPAQRWLAAYAAALQAGALIVDLNARDLNARGAGGARTNAWQTLGRIAPGLAEWAGYFGVLQAKREVVAAGPSALVSVREADDLVRDAGLFCDAVAQRLGRRRGGATSGSVQASARPSCRRRC